MSFLLDTNVVSEWVTARPDPGVVGWLAETDEDRIFMSVVTLAELRYGVQRLANGRRRKRLDAWLREELPQRFEGRILAVDQAVADICGSVVAKRDAAGRPIGVIDAFVVATATAHSLTIVTRNTSEFEPSEVPLINPWTF